MSGLVGGGCECWTMRSAHSTATTAGRPFACSTFAEHLPAKQFVAPADAEQRSIRDVLLHLTAAQRRWLAWWGGSLPPGEAQRLTLDPSDFPDVASVRAAYTETADRMQAFTATLTEDDLAGVFDAGPWSAMLWQLMLHVANHGTQHRSEVAALLTAQGQSPGDIDLNVYYAEQG